MNIIFKKIIAKNFMSFRDIEFDFSQFGDKMVLISGKNEDVNSDTKNGAGKSTLENALVFAIYGSTLNGLKNINIANWRATKNDDVVVSLDVISDNKSYKIIRKLTGKSRTSSLQVIELGDEDKDLTLSTIAETQNFIETNIVPCGLDGFVRCIVLTANNNFNFFTLNKSAKNEFFEGLFELSTYTEMYNKVHEDLLALNNEVKVSSSLIEEYNRSKKQTEESKEKLLKNSEELIKIKDFIQTLKEQLDSFDKENDIHLTESGEMINPSEDKFKEYQNKINELNIRIKKGSQLKYEVENSIQELNTKIKNTELRISHEEDNQKRYLNIINEHQPTISLFCDVCREKYKSMIDIDSYYKKIEQSKQTVDKLKDIISKSSTQIEPITKKLSLYKDGIEKLSNSLIQLKTEQASVNTVFDKLLYERNSILNKLSSYEITAKSLEKNASSGHDAVLETINENIQKETEKFYSLQEKYAHLKVLNDIIKPENVRKHIIPSMLNELNFRIAGYLNRTGANYDCKFDEKFDATFTTACGKTAEYGNFSSGEHMRLSISCCMAFREFMQVRLNIHTNILIIDEYIDSNLDSGSVNGVIELLHDMIEKEHFTAYIISHRTEIMNSQSDAEILISKKNDESSISIVRNY